MYSVAHKPCHLPRVAISLDCLEQNQCCSGTDCIYRVVSAAFLLVCERSGMLYNGCAEGLFKARGLWVLTQLPRERRWDEGDREIWVKPLWASGSGVMMAIWNDDERQEEVFQTGVSNWETHLSLRTWFWLLKIQWPQLMCCADEGFVYMCGAHMSVCVFILSCVEERLFLSLSAFILQGDPWLSHQQTLCFLCVCVCVSKLFVLIRIKGLFSERKL